MAIQDVLQFGNPFLRESCVKVVDFESPEILKTGADLQDTLHDLQRIHGRGGGLAAPQIGSRLRMVYVNARDRSFHLCNPEIVERSKETFEVWDFCFSAGASFLAQVTRNLRIRVEYQDIAGGKLSEEFEGYFSELLQHEIDHLDGTLFIDRVNKPESFTMVEEWDKQHADQLHNGRSV
jgi:peptide deformylase